MFRIAKQLLISQAFGKCKDASQVMLRLTAMVNELDEENRKQFASKVFLQFKSCFSNESIDRLLEISQEKALTHTKTNDTEICHLALVSKDTFVKIGYL